MLRTVPLIAVALMIALTGCSDSGGTSSNGSPSIDNGPTLPPVTAVAKPTVVPVTAEAVQSEVTLGRIVQRANAAPETEDTRLLIAATCQESVMVLRTSRETIYAGLPCDHFWDADTTPAFAGQEVAIRLAVDHVRFRIFVETLAGAQAEFTVSGVWLDNP